MRRLRGLIVPLLVLAAWEAAGRGGVIALYLSTPSAISAALAELVESGEIATHMASSLLRAVSGYAIGALAGAGVGLAAGAMRPVRDFFEPVVSLVYPIPKIVFLPILILALGLGHGSKIAAVALSVFFPMFLSGLYAVRGVPRVQIWSARSMGAHRLRVFSASSFPPACRCCSPACASGSRCRSSSCSRPSCWARRAGSAT